jgi:lauroyl/myristoyl acyltransferase
MGGTPAAVRNAFNRVGAEAGGLLFLLVEHSARVLPPSWLFRLSHPVGVALRPDGRKTRAVAMMKAVLERPDWTNEQWEDLWRRHVEAVGRFVVEQMRWLRLPPAEILGQIRIEGAERLDQALAGNRGAVLLCAHTANFAAGLAVAPMSGRDTKGFGTPLRSRLAERSYVRYHRGFGLDRQPTRRGVSAEIGQLLGRGGVAVTFYDLTTVPKHNAWVPFGHAETLVSLGPALLALRNDVEAIPVMSSVSPGGEHLVTFHPALARPRSGDPLRDAFTMTCEAMRRLTDEVERAPERWWNWDLGRFRDDQGRTSGYLGGFEIHEFTRENGRAGV